MKAILKEHGAEALIGLLVVLLAIWFVLFAWQRTGGGNAVGGVLVNAQFSSAGGLKVGTDVKIAGIKVGSVRALRLDPKSYMADATLALDPAVKVPADSSAAITSEGLLGGTYMQLIPGGDPTPLKSGDTIVDTQGALDLNSLIGQFINKSGSGSGGSAAAPAAGGAGAGPAS
jgi:phospholipid/cholesterol/gamma-HCH transport system substrate-binding protein